MPCNDILMDSAVYEILPDSCKYCLLEFADLEPDETFQCESCGQGYHGSHFIDQVQDGYCLTCNQSLISEIDMEIYNIVDFVNGQLQFQAKIKISKGNMTNEVVSDTCRYCWREFNGLERGETFQCESCGQGYHGWHFIDQVQAGYCLTCKQSLISEIDMEIYNIVNFINGQVHVQPKANTTEGSSISKKLITTLGIMVLSLLSFSYFLP